MYTPSASDVGTVVTMTLTVGGVADSECGAAIDEMTVTFSEQPTADAGVDQTICATDTSAMIAGVISGVPDGRWTTTGDGTFGNADELVTVYTPGLGDKAAGTVNLVLTSGGNGSCPVSYTHLTLPTIYSV